VKCELEVNQDKNEKMILMNHILDELEIVILLIIKFNAL
jgi:hypothetical protein